MSTIVTQLVFNRTIAGLGWRAGPWRYLALFPLVPVVYGLTIYVPVWVVGAGRFDGSLLARALPLLPRALAQRVVFADGEGIGWRGFLVPVLHRAHGFAWSAVTVAWLRLRSGSFWTRRALPWRPHSGDPGDPRWEHHRHRLDEVDYD